MNNFYIASLPLFICLLISFCVNKRLNKPWLKFFPLYLLLKSITEFVAYNYSAITHHSNHFIINLVFLLDFPFYFFVFYKVFNDQKYKKLTLLFSLIFLGFYIYNIGFNQGFRYINSYTFSLGSLFLIITSLIYFVQVFNSDKEINYFRIPMFWISTGIMFNYVCNLIYWSLVGYIIANHVDPDGFIFGVVLTISNLVLYGFISIGFLSNIQWNQKRL